MKLIIPKHRINYDGFQRTEFYNDFLKPQNIHYKLVFNLTTENEIVGKIMLTRSKKIDHFTPNDIKVAEYISPYLAHGLYHNTLRSQVKMQSNIINYLENQFSTGIILLDKNLKTIYMNQKARKLLRYFNASGKVDQKTMQLDSKLLEDCRKLQAKLIKFPTNSTVIPEKRVIKGRDKKRFNLTSKTFDPQQGWDSSCAFMICIEELSESNDIKWKRFMKYFHLSPREIDVLPYLFSGLKNAEIAEKLFVSEITIKKHLQSIYAKVGVKNRTSLINKIVTQFPASPLTVQKWS
jgi:DNA-binding CsgD family transcriptional regulator